MHLLYLELQLMFSFYALSFVLKQKKQKFKTAYNYWKQLRFATLYFRKYTYLLSL